MKTRNRLLTLAAAALAAATVAPKTEASPGVSWSVAVGPVYVARYHNPYRVIGGYRYYRYCPGPGYVRVSYGWAFRPYPAAVWVPPHHGPGGFWVRGCWR